MRNVTVSVPDEVYRSARIRAAELGKSVSALVTDYLNSLNDREGRFVRLEAKQKQVQSRIRDFRAGDRLGRDEIHRRALP